MAGGSARGRKLEKHQALIVAHRDGHPHVHVIVNRVDQDALEHGLIDRSDDLDVDAARPMIVRDCQGPWGGLTLRLLPPAGAREAMTREPLSDSDRWFDPDKATTWTGTVDLDEKLYRTHLGGWVLYEGLYRSVSERQAVAWLIRNEHKGPYDAADTAAELEIQPWPS